MNDPVTTPDREYVGQDLLARHGHEHHIVQFYENDSFLISNVSDFLAAGLLAGEPLVVIATEDHRVGIVSNLTAKGFDMDRLRNDNRLQLFDARATLAEFMVDGSPDWDRFHATLAPVLAIGDRGPRVRAYGEMVNLLWADGNTDAAVRLEELWNDIAQLYPLTLLCAYQMDHCGKDEHRQAFRRVCAAHSHVLPTESYAEIQDPEIRLREVSLLQQRARALESEIEERKRIEAKLRDSLRIRDDFLSIASHELRTPLTALQLYISTVDRLAGASDSEPLIQKGLSKASRQVARLRSLVEQLLDIPSLDNQTLRLEKAPVDLSSLVRSIATAHAGTAEDEGCQLRIHADAPVHGEWDGKRIEQVVAILLANAIKYGRDAPIDVTVDSDDQIAYVKVRDRGIGVDAEHHARIFQKLERAAPLPHYSGFGLGLWIAKQIVDAHGGHIRLSSAPDKGAEFTVELPL